MTVMKLLLKTCSRTDILQSIFGTFCPVYPESKRQIIAVPQYSFTRVKTGRCPFTLIHRCFIIGFVLVEGKGSIFLKFAMLHGIWHGKPKKMLEIPCFTHIAALHSGFCPNLSTDWAQCAAMAGRDFSRSSKQ